MVILPFLFLVKRLFSLPYFFIKKVNKWVTTHDDGENTLNFTVEEVYAPCLWMMHFLSKGLF